MGRKSLGKPIDDSADLAWLRQSSMAAIEALREHQNRRGQHLTNVSIICYLVLRTSLTPHIPATCIWLLVYAVCNNASNLNRV